ncbi:MAG: hypothetical protein KC636_04570 [Myxococcales bacterium]|nr:hypothetical protein [Myxococcales bacterium]
MARNNSRWPWMGASGSSGTNPMEQLLKMQQQWLESMSQGFGRAGANPFAGPFSNMGPGAAPRGPGMMGGLLQMQTKLQELERRVAELEACNEVLRFMYDWAFQIDQTQTLPKAEAEAVARHIVDDRMTPDGTFDFSTIPGWLGVWGPDKQDIVDKLMVFGEQIEWSYHLYPNGTPTVDLSRGTATFTTQSEVVPLRQGRQGAWLFLRQVSTLAKVGDGWRMRCYELSDLRQTQGDLSPMRSSLGASASAGARESGGGRRVVRRGD